MSNTTPRFGGSDERRVWETFAAAALSGAMANDPTTWKAKVANAAEAADELVKEWKTRQGIKSEEP